MREYTVEEFRTMIELADNIDEIARLRDELEENDVECRLEMSCLLSEKEDEYGLQKVEGMKMTVEGLKKIIGTSKTEKTIVTKL